MALNISVTFMLTVQTSAPLLYCCVYKKKKRTTTEVKEGKRKMLSMSHVSLKDYVMSAADNLACSIQIHYHSPEPETKADLCSTTCAVCSSVATLHLWRDTVHKNWLNLGPLQ